MNYLDLDSIRIIDRILKVLLAANYIVYASMDCRILAWSFSLVILILLAWIIFLIL